MDTDTMIYAVLAIVIFAKLWSVLGHKNEGDPDNSGRPNPFSAPSASKQAANDEDAPLRGTSPEGAMTLEHPPVSRPMVKPLLHAPASLAGILAQIKDIDASFDEKNFLATVKQSFTAIVGDFASGDLTRTAALLGPHVKPAFEAAIKARQAAGQTATCKVQRIREADVERARLDGHIASITVRIVSEQQNTLRDAHGDAAAAGHDGKLEEITDIWTFARDLTAADASWVLAETKS